MKSVDAGGEKELLDDRHNLVLTEVKEELFKLLLVNQFKIRLALKTKMAAARIGKKLSKPIILSKSMFTYTCSRTIIRKSMKPLANFLIVELIMYLNWVKS